MAFYVFCAFCMVFTGGCTVFIHAAETKMLAKQVQINKVIGSILCVLGVILLLPSFSRAR